MKKHNKPAYTFPGSEEELLVDAITFGMLHAIQDGMNDADTRGRAQKALTRFLCKITTNDAAMFQEVFIDAYVTAYNEKQQRFREGTSLHHVEVKNITKMGGYEKTFEIMRSHIKAVTQVVRGDA